MLRRTRTTKKLARRIDLQYFTRPHPFRRWRFWLSVAAPLLALGWLFTLHVQGGQKAYSSGPLSQSHAVFSQQCGLCHVTRAGAFFKEVRDDACLACHDAPIHQSNQAFTPSCSSCHLEHRGRIRLAATSDASCTQCHANLKTRSGQPRYVAAIASFDGAHPEFSPLAKGKTDPAQIRLNHYLHLQANLVGPNNQRLQMTCDDCHRTASDTQGVWPYATPSTTVGPEQGAVNPQQHGREMLRIQFSNHCSGCHTLQFDRRFGDLQVPHDQPEIVHAFVTKEFGQYISSHPASVHEVEPANRQLPERMRTRPVAHSASEWVQFRVEEAEWLLWTKTCKQCHVLVDADAQLPKIAPANITERWLPHAAFDHRSHRMMSCLACHARVPQSHETADVLIPGIQTCQKCHRESSTHDSAEGRCFECHEYHDWTKAKRTKGRFNIPELRGTAELLLPQSEAAH